MNPEDIDRPEVRREVEALFRDYERALMANDVAALNDYFWRDARLTRYGIADLQLGYDALVAFRAATPAPDFTRELSRVRIHTFGSDTAVAMCEFRRSDTRKLGMQTQTWLRFADGWKIVSAHVSTIDPPQPKVAAQAHIAERCDNRRLRRRVTSRSDVKARSAGRSQGAKRRPKPQSR
jgi:ketosteroid isomerase-like protein